MKIYIGKPRDNWVSPYRICEKVCFWREIDYDEPWVKFSAKLLAPFCEAWQKFLNVVHPKIDYIKIDRWDTWSMDSTLSPIILPMLKQLKKDKHGAPYVDDADVPPKLRSKPLPVKPSNLSKSPDVHKINDNLDSKFFKRWDYVIDEMIWTFEQLCDWDNDGKFYTHITKTKDWDWENEESINKSIRNIKVDKVGLKKHHDRIDNGLRLFGKYYRALWD
jgi:hypothetical protein